MVVNIQSQIIRSVISRTFSLEPPLLSSCCSALCFHEEKKMNAHLNLLGAPGAFFRAALVVSLDLGFDPLLFDFLLLVAILGCGVFVVVDIVAGGTLTTPALVTASW